MDSRKIRCIEKAKENLNQQLDLCSMYLYAMKSPVTIQKYSKRLEIFFNFICIATETTNLGSSLFYQKVIKLGN